MFDPTKREYPCAIDILAALKIFLAARKEDENLDMDDVIYDIISEWDEYFEDDEEWFSEDDSDIKDVIRDEVLQILNS